MDVEFADGRKHQWLIRVRLTLSGHAARKAIPDRVHETERRA
jgi:hypothetical protein